jgi:hypothetical protein
MLFTLNDDGQIWDLYFVLQYSTVLLSVHLATLVRSLLVLRTVVLHAGTRRSTT